MDTKLVTKTNVQKFKKNKYKKAYENLNVMRLVPLLFETNIKNN